MNIEDLKLSEIRQIAAIARALDGGVNERPASISPLIGRHVIVRTYSAGVHAGKLVSQDGDVVVLANSRRLWSWKAKSGVALSGLAVGGLASGKVDTMTNIHQLIGAIEIIPTSAESEASINGA